MSGTEADSMCSSFEKRPSVLLCTIVFSSIVKELETFGFKIRKYYLNIKKCWAMIGLVFLAPCAKIKSSDEINALHFCAHIDDLYADVNMGTQLCLICL